MAERNGQTQPTSIVLTITWDGPGNPVSVNGPIQDKMLCYAMLELAKDAIREFADVQAKQLVKPVTLAPPSHLKLV